MSMRHEENDIYIIPPNFIDTGTVFGGTIKLRNAAEALVLSLLIGFLSAGISTALAALFGTVSGLAPRRLDELLMRLTEIFLSIPSLLLIVLLQAVLGVAGPVAEVQSGVRIDLLAQRAVGNGVH